MSRVSTHLVLLFLIFPTDTQGSGEVETPSMSELNAGVSFAVGLMGAADLCLSACDSELYFTPTQLLCCGYTPTASGVNQTPRCHNHTLLSHLGELNSQTPTETLKTPTFTQILQRTVKSTVVCELTCTRYI